MKWVLMLELIFSSGYGKGASIHTQYFQTEQQCEVVARVFLNDNKYNDYLIDTQLKRRATCIKLKGGE